MVISPLEAHPDRTTVLAEVHARPFHPVNTPCRILLFAFMTDGSQSQADRHALSELCRHFKAAEPLEGAKHHRVELGRVMLRWEQHAEFTTYSWELVEGLEQPFAPIQGSRFDLMRQLPQPGPHLASIDLHMLPAREDIDPGRFFDQAGLAMSSVYREDAVIATDFKSDHEGFVRILVLDHGLGPARAGSLLQRLLEIETYRMLALLGLPEAARTAPAVKAVEDALVRIGRQMIAAEGGATDHELLDELTELAAKLEADSALSGYRFGASRAYDTIVSQRLTAIDEKQIKGWVTLEGFLSRRVAPAMRTCQMLEDRQANLSRKLTRAANLLRTRVDVEIERQNRDLLASMNRRARLQLRLQQTVEGLSVAAVSYYIVGLASYLIKGIKDAGLLHIEAGTATAMVVPVSVIAVALVVRRIRRAHAHED
jgi:uncharacterized membrane-anchored protein